MSTDSPGNGKYRPPSFLTETVALLERDRTDPAAAIPGAPPNFGRFPLAHVDSFQGFASTIANTYRDYDEALKDSLENARYMRNDCGLMECLEARQRGTALLNWHLEPEDPDSHEQRELCTALDKILRRIRRFTEYRRVLLEAIWYGKYAIQNRYGWETINGHSRLMPKGIRENPGWQPINGDKLVFRFETAKNRPGQWPYQLGIRVSAGRTQSTTIADRWKIEATDRGMAYFPAEYERRGIVVHKHHVEDGAYEDILSAGMLHGVGVRSRIYWDWVQKQESLAFLVEFLERSAGGVEIWKYPQGNAQAKQEVVEAATRRQGGGRNALIVPIPMGDDGMQYGMQVVEPGFQGIEVVQHLLTHYYGHRIKRYILGQILTSEAEATGLGSGVAEAHLDSFMQIVRYDAQNLEETMTQDLVKNVKDWNFPSARDLHVRFAIETQTPDAAEKLRGFAEAWQIGARIKEQDVLDTIGAAVPTETDRVLANPQLQQPAGMPGAGQPGGSQVSVTADIATDPASLAQEVAQNLSGSIPDDAQSMYVAEGDQLVRREIPDPEQDTGERHKLDSYARGDNGKTAPRDDKGRYTRVDGAFESFLDACLSTQGKTHITHEVGPVPENVAAAMKLATGRDFSNASYFVDSYAIRHIQLKHGNEQVPSQLSVGREELLRIPRVMLRPDDVADAGVGRTGRSSIALRKRIGDHHEMILEFREKRSRLALKTMYIREKKAGPVGGRPKRFRVKYSAPHAASRSPIIDHDGYARKRKSADVQGEFRWITIGGESNPETGARHEGGTPVQIDVAGRIVKGPDAITGKKVDELSRDDPGEAAHDAADSSEKPSEDIRYVNGDAATPTGETQIIHGAEFEAVKLIEGRLTGEIRWLKTRAQEKEDVMRRQREWHEQQEEFRRLHKFSEKTGNSPDSVSTSLPDDVSGPDDAPPRSPSQKIHADSLKAITAGLDARMRKYIQSRDRGAVLQAPSLKGQKALFSRGGEAQWNEADHPREPAGAATGGQFTEKAGGGSGGTAQAAPWLEKARQHPIRVSADASGNVRFAPLTQAIDAQFPMPQSAAASPPAKPRRDREFQSEHRADPTPANQIQPGDRILWPYGIGRIPQGAAVTVSDVQTVGNTLRIHVESGDFRNVVKRRPEDVVHKVADPTPASAPRTQDGIPVNEAGEPVGPQGRPLTGDLLREQQDSQRGQQRLSENPESTKKKTLRDVKGIGTVPKLAGVLAEHGHELLSANTKLHEGAWTTSYQIKQPDGTTLDVSAKAMPQFVQDLRDRADASSPVEPAAPQQLPGAIATLQPAQPQDDGRIVGAAQMHYRDLHVDPERFQYKVSGISAAGVGEELAGVRQFNPMLGGQLLVWKDPADGKTYVVNGHHRHELAVRSGEHAGWDGKMSVYFVDAQDAMEARAHGALTNIAEGRGTAIDAAKFLRDTGTDAGTMAEQHGVSLTGKVARDGVALTNLSDKMFQQLTQGEIGEGRALAIANYLPDHDKQNDLAQLIRRSENKTGKELSDAVVAEMARELDVTPVKRSQQGGLFGAMEMPLIAERAHLKASLRRAITGERNVFKQASTARRANLLESSGENKLDIASNKQAAQAADSALWDFDRRVNASGDPLAKAVSNAAEQWSAAKTERERRNVESDLAGVVRKLLEIESRAAGPDLREPQEPAGSGSDPAGA